MYSTTGKPVIIFGIINTKRPQVIFSLFIITKSLPAVSQSVVWLDIFNKLHIINQDIKANKVLIDK